MDVATIFCWIVSRALLGPRANSRAGTEVNSYQRVRKEFLYKMCLPSFF